MEGGIEKVRSGEDISAVVPRGGTQKRTLFTLLRDRPGCLKQRR